MEFKVDLDLYTGLDSEGLSASVFIGNACDPLAEMEITWEESVDELIDAHCTPGGALVYEDSDYNSVEEVFKLAGKLRAVADYCESKINEKRIFLRNEWEAAGYPQDKDEFIVDYNGYLDRVVGQGNMF